MLRKVRIALAAIFFICITLLLAGIGGQWWGWMAKLQFLPACLALNLAVIIGVLLSAVLLGRVYCSFICPLGVFQDLIIRLRRLSGKKKFAYRKAGILRYIVLAVFIACLVADLQFIVALIAPYSAYGRMVGSLVHPHGWIVPAVAGVTFLLTAILAWTSGRVWCNEICPVGTALGLFSRFSIFGVHIDRSKCVGCKLCEKNCKCHCIDSASGIVDRSRCVVCLDCIGSCRKGGVSYGLVKRKSSPSAEAASDPSFSVDQSRRAFMVAGALMGTSALAHAQNKLDGGLAPVVPKQAPVRGCRLTPPGSGSLKDFYSRCTACQLCVSNCPNSVLRPSTDLEHLMQPEMGFEKGFCRPECTVCSTLCPAGAITPITPEEKTAIHIGHAVIDYSLCVSYNGEHCRSCGSHCPAGAISYVAKNPEDEHSVRIPTVHEDRCIGCGKCEYLCPSRPVSAIRVEGYTDHIIS